VKLSCYGIDGNASKWLASGLTEKFVKISNIYDDIYSNQNKVEHRVQFPNINRL
jgi:hypothetical protein